MAIYRIAALSFTLIVGSFAILALSGFASAGPITGQEIPDLANLANQNPLIHQAQHQRGRGHYRGGGRRYGGGHNQRRYGYRGGGQRYGGVYNQRRYGNRGGNYRYYRNRHGPRYRYRRRGYGHFYSGWWYSIPWWAGIGVYSNRGGNRYSGDGNAHVEYCLNRYRSYNVQTDQFLGYDGHYHYCNSPYR